MPDKVCGNRRNCAMRGMFRQAAAVMAYASCSNAPRNAVYDAALKALTDSETYAARNDNRW